ncbi:hypothetical protein JCM10212_003689 [Sporobolomyces blumeae]
MLAPSLGTVLCWASSLVKTLSDPPGGAASPLEPTVAPLSDPETRYSPFLPPAVPLAVKSPYVNAWLTTGGTDGIKTLSGQWARHWPVRWGPYSPKGFRLTWSGLIRIDGKTFEFLGAPLTDHPDLDLREGLGRDKAGSHKTGRAKQVAFEYTATRSIFSFDADGVEFNATFLSPVTPNDEVRTSLPFSYFAVDVDPRAVGERTIEVYSDIGGDWASGDPGVEIVWDFTAHRGAGIHSIKRKDQQVFSEYAEQAEWGSAIYATDSTRAIASSGPAHVLRSTFVEKGHLPGTFDSKYRKINDVDEPAFAFSVRFDKGEPARAVFTIGHVRSPYVNYVTPNGQITLEGLWTTVYPTPEDAVSAFQSSYSRNLREAVKFDSTLRQDALRVSGEKYASIAELSTRQAFATFEVTTGVGDDWSEDKERVMMWLKEISSNGDMSTIDVIFPLHPILLYTNPTLVALLLEPLLVYTHSGMYPNRWPVHDLGTYPNATGYNGGNDEPMPVEEAGNMLWMALSYYQLTSDLPWVEKHYDVLKSWTSYLIDDGLVPAEQLSTDDFSGRLANQTDLAVKAIVGIGAMAELAKQNGRWTDWIHYRSTAEAYVKEWMRMAMTETDGPHPHAKLAYQDEGSWGTLYNLLGDRILALDLFPPDLYKHQSEWYRLKREKFGVPLDSRHYWAKTDWQMFAAACSPDEETRDMFIDDLVGFLRAGKVDAAFPDLYETPTGNYPGEEGLDWGIRFISRPVVGGHFSLLALDAADAANGRRKTMVEGEGTGRGDAFVVQGGAGRELKWEKER